MEIIGQGLIGTAEGDDASGSGTCRGEVTDGSNGYKRTMRHGQRVDPISH